MGGSTLWYVKPVTTRPLTSWGRYPSCGVHRALDYPTPVGTPFRCAAPGTVTTVGWSYSGFGRHIRVKLDDGNTVIYGHLSSYAVKLGQRVRAGQIIGYTGNTGNSTGPHLHMEVRKYSYAPYSAWDFTSRLINYTAPVSSPTTAKDWFDMATKDDLRAVLREPAYLREVARYVLTGYLFDHDSDSDTPDVVLADALRDLPDEVWEETPDGNPYPLKAHVLNANITATAAARAVAALQADIAAIKRKLGA